MLDPLHLRSRPRPSPRSAFGSRVPGSGSGFGFRGSASGVETSVTTNPQPSASKPPAASLAPIFQDPKPPTSNNKFEVSKKDPLCVETSHSRSVSPPSKIKPRNHWRRSQLLARGSTLGAASSSLNGSREARATFGFGEVPAPLLPRRRASSAWLARAQMEMSQRDVSFGGTKWVCTPSCRSFSSIPRLGFYPGSRNKGTKLKPRHEM